MERPGFSASQIGLAFDDAIVFQRLPEFKRIAVEDQVGIALALALHLRKEESEFGGPTEVLIGMPLSVHLAGAEMRIADEDAETVVAGCGDRGLLDRSLWRGVAGQEVATAHPPCGERE